MGSFTTSRAVPALADRKGAVILLRAPIIRNMAISAVALLTAIGVLATDMPEEIGQSSAK